MLNQQRVRSRSTALIRALSDDGCDTASHRLPIRVRLDRSRHRVTVCPQQEDAESPLPGGWRGPPVVDDVNPPGGRAAGYPELLSLVAVGHPAQVGIMVPETLEGWTDDAER